MTLAIAMTGVLAPAAAEAIPVSYTFDTDASGWETRQGDSDLTPSTFSAAGGNPGGAITATDTGPETGCPNDPCDLLLFFSPQVASGSLAANYGGTISFDLNSSAARDFYAVAFFTPLAAVPGLRVVFQNDSPTAGWHSYSAPITEAALQYCPAFNVPCVAATKAQVESVLATAVYVDVNADLVDGTTETYALDNFRLTDGPPAPPPVTPAPVKKPKKCKRKKGKKAATAKKKKCKRKKKRSALSRSAARPGL